MDDMPRSVLRSAGKMKRKSAAPMMSKKIAMPKNAAFENDIDLFSIRNK